MNEYPDIFCIVDTETTGMRPPFSRIIDLGLIRVEHGKEVERFQTLVNPGTSVPARIQSFTSITDEELATAPSFEEVALQVQELLADAVFVAHNAPFDYAFMQSEFARLGMEWRAETLCSVKLSRALTPKARSHNLDSVIERYGLRIMGQRHRALPDAEAVWEFMKRAGAEHPRAHLRKAVAAARAGGSTPAIAKNTFTDLPDSAGVYFFYGPEQELLYIGKSKHVRTRARSHFHTSPIKKEQRIQEQTHAISSVKTSGELSALLLESALIKAQSPMLNRALCKRKLLVLALQDMRDDGYRTLTLTRAADIDPHAGVLSVFRTQVQAKAKLRELAKEYQLCHKLLGIEAGTGACFAYQLGACRGACAGKELPAEFNERFADAFAARKLRAWPYAGTVMIDEKESEESGTAIFVRDWVLLGAYKYDGEAYEPLFDAPEEARQQRGFDYDSYKILARYLPNPKNRRSIRTLTAREYRAAMARIEGGDAEAVPRGEFIID
jgi:DNA polymerase-3 subunit epsilon